VIEEDRLALILDIEILVVADVVLHVDQDVRFGLGDVIDGVIEPVDDALWIGARELSEREIHGVPVQAEQLVEIGIHLYLPIGRIFHQYIVVLQ
jgi:hypothetical protein